MESKNDVYVISLDAVDLNSLPISQKRSGGAVPLWSRSNLDSKRNEYYEFVIKYDDTEEDQNDDIIEKVVCHICDINVPKMYFNEHKNGFRHKFNKKVADTALKRLQLYLNQDDINDDNEKIPSKHFCTECSTVIHSEDETSHKQTIGHRNAVFLERFLNDFLNFYTNDDNETVGNTRKDVKTKIVEENKNSKETVSINSKKESTKTESANETKSDENSKRILNSDEQSNHLSPSCDLKDGEMMFEIVDSSNISKLKVTEQCYHAIVETGVALEYCMICDQMFGRENRNLHVDSDLHDQKLRQKSLDKNCVRMINSSQYHCILCNDYFTEYDLHVNRKKHLTNLQNQMIYKCKKAAQDNDDCNKDKKSDNSKECNNVLKSDVNKSSTDTNKNTASVNKETSNSLVPSTSSFVDADETAENSDRTVKIDANLYFCHVCQVKVPNNLNNIAQHNRGKSHMLKENNQMKVREVDPPEKARETERKEENSNSLVPSSNASVDIHPKVFCDTCNIWISKKKFKKHSNTMTHTFNEMSNCHYLMQYLDEENLFCEICNVTVSSVLVDIKNHFTSSDHIKKYDKLFKAHSITKINNCKYYCTECKVYILHKNDYLHIKSEEHTDKVGLSKTDEIDEQSDDITGSTDSDATIAVTLVDSNTVEDGSGNATDSKKVDTSNSTALETVDQLGINCINLKASLNNTFIDKLKLKLPKYFSQREPSSDREFNSADNVSKIDKSSEDSEQQERFQKIPDNKGRSHMLKDNKPIEERAVDPGDNVSKIDETVENSDKTVKLDPKFIFL